MTRSHPAKPVKTTIVLPAEAMEVLRELSGERNVSFAEVVRRALTIEKYLADSRKDGCRILVEDPEKALKELVIL